MIYWAIRKNKNKTKPISYPRREPGRQSFEDEKEQGVFIWTSLQSRLPRRVELGYEQLPT